MKTSFAERIHRSMFVFVIPMAILIAWAIYAFILGSPTNFEGGNNLNEPLKNNYLGIVYKGGPIVILLISFQVILLTYIIERFLSIGRAAGKGNLDSFVKQVKSLLSENKNDEIIALCDKYRGSVANVVKNGLTTFFSVSADEEMDKESKLAAVQKDLEEATQLELPQLNNNMIIISTLASISTLIGLLGTVTGMIKAFSALARVGSPDAIGLANGISQALVTTALGITTAAIAIVFFNFFSSRIDRIIYSIDETSYSIINTFKAKS